MTERRKPYRPDSVRAGGDVTCTVCGCEHWEHAPVQGFEWLHRLCNGTLVKL